MIFFFVLFSLVTCADAPTPAHPGESRDPLSATGLWPDRESGRTIVSALCARDAKVRKFFPPLIPAQAGTQQMEIVGQSPALYLSDWIPACAGMSG